MEIQGQRQAYLQREREQEQYNEQIATQSHEGVECPKCGSVNEPGAVFCENCGHALSQKSCPFCNAPLEAGADVCEVCHRYVLDNVCSFCGSTMASDDQYCPECGMAREGITCPVCHTLNIFSVCVNCGTPLTDSAKLEQKEVRRSAEYMKMKQLAKDLEYLQHQIVPSGEEAKELNRKCEDIRNRVLSLLNDDGIVPPLSSPMVNVQTEQDLVVAIAQKRLELQNLLNGMASKKQVSAAMTRRYMLVRKPPLSRLGWKCNFKSEMHRGPQDCACPQMGGTWVVLDGKEEKELKGK